MEAAINNSLGAMKSVSDWRTIKTDDGELIESGQERYVEFRANAAIAKGQACALNVTPVAGTPLSVGLMTTSDSPAIFAGIATKSAASGANVRLCVEGIVEAFVNAQTVAFGNFLLVPGTNTGEPSGSSTALSATTVAGTVLGVVLGAKNSANLAPVIINRD